MALRRELREVRGEADDLAHRTRAAEETKEAAANCLRELEEQGERLLGDRQEAEKRLFMAAQSQENNQKELHRGEQRLEANDRELEPLLDEQKALKLRAWRLKASGSRLRRRNGASSKV